MWLYAHFEYLLWPAGLTAGALIVAGCAVALAATRALSILRGASWLRIATRAALVGGAVITCADGILFLGSAIAGVGRTPSFPWTNRGQATYFGLMSLLFAAVAARHAVRWRRVLAPDVLPAKRALFGLALFCFGCMTFSLTTIAFMSVIFPALHPDVTRLMGR